MDQRIDYMKIAPEGYAAMLGLERYIHHCGLEPSPLELIKLRASQINGWNRLAVSFRKPAGTYQAGALQK